MRRRLLLGLITFLTLWLPSLADDYQVPTCTADEFVTLFDLIVELQVQANTDLLTFKDLLQASQRQIDERETVLSQLPLCADGIETRVLLLQLGVDIVARTALEFAALPTDANPYRQRLASDHERIETVTSAMLSRDRSDATAPEDRRILACALTDLAAINKLATEFMSLVAEADATTSRDKYIDSLDRRLAWREDNLADLPACAEAIELALLVNRASSDAAANHALAFAGVSAQTNPYHNLEAAGIAELQVWQERIKATRASARSQAGPSTGALPPCTDAELFSAWQSLQPLRAILPVQGAVPATLTAILDFSQAELDSRVSAISQLPNCAEALYAGWWLAEALSDLAADAAFAETAMIISARATTSRTKAEAALARMERLLAGQPSASIPATRNAAACRDADTIYFNVYILPAFHEFTEAALSAATPAAATALAARSFAFRDKLWAHLPRCAEALEIGWLMRGISADFIAMIALESAGTAPRQIPYLQSIIDDIADLSALIDTLNADSVFAAGLVYYVIADGYANIRSCGSTECSVVGVVQRGEALRVLDDQDTWFEIQLSDGGTAWIAGFLTEKTPPGA